MYHPWVLFVAARYLHSPRRHRFAAFVAVVSVMGIALSVAALIIVLSVMNGFEREVTRHVLGMSAHAVLVPPQGSLNNWREVLAAAEDFGPVTAASPYVRGSGMLSRKGSVRGVLVEGIVPRYERRVAALDSYLDASSLTTLTNDPEAAIIGRNLARDLDLAAGDWLTLVVPNWDADGRLLAPRYARFRIAGLFHVGMHQYDTRLVLLNFGAAQDLLGLGNAASGIRLRFTHPQAAPLGVRELAQSLDERLAVIDWTQYHRNFFLALKSQKRIMFIVLGLVIAVAAFNIAANMVMVVAEKIRSIAILRTLGARRGSIVVLFLVQGVLIGSVGALIGAVLGAWGAHESAGVAAAIEALLDVDLINADVYFIDYLPAALNWADVVSVTSISLALSLLATLYPAWRAAGVQPAVAVHRD